MDRPSFLAKPILYSSQFAQIQTSASLSVSIPTSILHKYRRVDKPAFLSQYTLYTYTHRFVNGAGVNRSKAVCCSYARVLRPCHGQPCFPPFSRKRPPCLAEMPPRPDYQKGRAPCLPRPRADPDPTRY